MTILVTGTAGFIGYHVARVLLERGRQVIGYDNLNDYYSVRLKRDRHGRLTEWDRFTAVEADLCDADRLASLFGAHEIRQVCHLAAQAGVRYSLVNPGAYQRSNLEGFLNIMEMARRHQVERFVYASSSSVYGGQPKVPFAESDPVDRPVSLYAATKKANELMAHTYTHLYGMPTIGLRFFTVYGPWGRPDMAVWLFARAILQNEPIRIFNYGRMHRDFTYIEDILAGVLAALDTTGLEPYELINLGNNHPENLLDMVDLLEELLAVPARKEMLPMQPGDVPATWADITRARAKLGYEPQISLKEGLTLFVDWFVREGITYVD
ncbi:MAG: GDP-mannose 4,6-dehydratase [Acidobacteria bacterium]|nr:GDP-mannose 4,6-dehydratase [Acidobacteriota bacterium]